MDLNKKLNVVFVGGTERAVLTFREISARDDICCSLLLIMKGYPDEHQFASNLVEQARSRSIPYFLVDKIDDDIVNYCKELAPDLYLGIGVWRSLLPIEFIQAARLGYLALHGSALPDYRGWAGINWQIINGEQELRMRGLQLADGVDNGPLICRADGSLLEYSIDLQNEKHLSEIFIDYNAMHIRACNEILDLVKNNTISFIKQRGEDATYSCQRGPDDGEIYWSGDTLTVFNFIRAQSHPYQGAFTYFKGKKIILWRVAMRPDFKNYKGRIAGKVVYRDTESGNVVVLTADAGIEICEAQESGCGKRPAVEIFNSVREKCKNRNEAYLDSIGWK